MVPFSMAKSLTLEKQKQYLIHFCKYLGYLINDCPIQ